ncbi:MAG TPA: sodium:proton antiporter [Alphaproteobacteria bacterium]|jgi:Na+/H+ antiporter NhaD/arsenite permease-like protein|nr:sodium:proton antiporter [Alphaproteobacteria bacterium]
MARFRISALVAAAVVLLPVSASAAEMPVDGRDLGLVWILPFAGLLLSIAGLSLVAPFFWHRNYGKITAGWAAAFLIPFGARFGWGAAWHELIHVLIVDYIPFITLLAALYTAAGGVRLKGSLSGRTASNVLFLAGGTVLASVIGTTGACMLLIKPLLRANAWRQRTVHTWVFFIFLVGNIGGALSPLGDPPLYIGYLQGVHFFWPTVHLAGPTGLVAALLLVVYALVDTIALRREADEPPKSDWNGIEGARNIAVLVAIPVVVLVTGAWDSGVTLTIAGIDCALEDVVRTLGVAALGVLAWAWTNPLTFRHNEFSWEPIREVAKLFAGIFVCIVPALAIIGAGEEGAAAPVVQLLNSGGHPDEAMYFWITGLLSSVLDNAPTYLLFFNLAGGDPQLLQTSMARTLQAISAGAVFMGAMTYIGNAPNFMVRGVVTAHGRRMPSFFAYIAWSVTVLGPAFAAVHWTFF